MKKIMFIILGVLALTGCSNPIKKAEKEISALLEKEFSETEKICLEEYSEDKCIPIEFTVSYDKENDRIKIYILDYMDSSVRLTTDKYSNEEELSKAAYNLVRELGVESDVYWRREAVRFGGDDSDLVGMSAYLNGEDF